MFINYIYTWKTQKMADKPVQEDGNIFGVTRNFFNTTLQWGSIIGHVFLGYQYTLTSHNVSNLVVPARGMLSIIDLIRPFFDKKRKRTNLITMNQAVSIFMNNLYLSPITCYLEQTMGQTYVVYKKIINEIIYTCYGLYHLTCGTNKFLNTDHSSILKIGSYISTLRISISSEQE